MTISQPDDVRPTKHLRVFAAHRTDRTGGNPDLALLYEAIKRSADIAIESASRRRLVVDRWDAIHVYWPEWCIRRDRGALVTALDGVAFLVAVAVAKARGARVVWSAHNLRPHEIDRFGVTTQFVTSFSTLVDQVICWTQPLLEEFIRHYPALGAADQRVIPPGHYRGVYPDACIDSAEARRRLAIPPAAKVALCLGMVRPYKNLDAVVRAHREVARTRDDAYLVVAGEALNNGYAARLRREARGVERVRLDFGFVPAARVPEYLLAADCVVIPPRHAVCSGSALLALSFAKRVIVPHRGFFSDLSQWLGPQWVQTYDGEFHAGVLGTALSFTAPEGSPPLARYFDWEYSGRLTAQALYDVTGVS